MYTNFENILIFSQKTNMLGCNVSAQYASLATEILINFHFCIVFLQKESRAKKCFHI